MKIHFYKYQATGNDFVMIDNRSGDLSLSIERIKSICDRRFGIGADGIMLIEKHPTAQFNLRYFNSDGSQSLCGNGSRAAVTMAASLGLVNGKARFEAYDGLHEAEIQPGGIVRLKMNNVTEVKKSGQDYFIHTGSPHFIRFVKDLKNYPVFEEGRKIRYSPEYLPGGTNVNFVEITSGNTIFVRTYERGVENETYSCGTGVTAAALAASFHHLSSPVSVKTLGGDLKVEFKARHSDLSSGQSGTFEEIFLIGPAKLVFEGDLEL
ncbi:MAG TPA: diaminopimelate epimerase [Chryseosolibacter sp.]|nr:diaminopimelate epimerase [Chryseosolibacter sp.]